MSSAKSKAISEIDLEEFERRLRVVRSPQAGVEDPLSELTRLINTIAADRPGTEKVVDIASARMPSRSPSRTRISSREGRRRRRCATARHPRLRPLRILRPRLSRRLRLRPSCRLRAS